MFKNIGKYMTKYCFLIELKLPERILYLRSHHEDGRLEFTTDAHGACKFSTADDATSKAQELRLGYCSVHEHGFDE